MTEKSQLNRTRIVEVARELIYEQGFAATSLSDVAKKLGIQKGHLSYYFKSKTELMRAVATFKTDQIRSQIEAWSLECGTAYDCLERVITMMESAATELAAYGCPIGTLCDELGKGNVELQAEVQDCFDFLLRWMTARFSSFMTPEDALVHAEQLLAMAEGVAVLGHAYRDPQMIQRQANQMRRWLRGVCGDA